MEISIKAYALLAKIIALQSESHGMVFTNQQRIERGEPVAYVDENFNKVAEQLYHLSKELMDIEQAQKCQAVVI